MSTPNPTAPSNIRTFKKGEMLFKEGDRTQSLWLIQTGQVALILQRPGERGKLNIDFVNNLGAGQIVGELGLAGSPTYPYSAMATAETKALELPVEAAKAQIEGFPQFAKMLAKSLTDRLKGFTTELRSVKLDRDATPCSPENTARIFGALYATLIWKGEKKQEKELQYWAISWSTLRSYAQRVFGQTPKKTETVANILVKLGAAKFVMGKNEEDDTDEIQGLQVFKMVDLDNFIDFYQHYYFKGGKMDLLKADDRSLQILKAIVKQVEPLQPDRTGIIRTDFSKVIEFVKTEADIKLNNDHFTLFETKGVYFKRHPTDKGIELHMEIAEIRKMVSHWAFLREVERWNEKGFIDPNEPVQVEKAKPEQLACPACQHPYTGAPKFCSECGHKFVDAA